MQGQNDLQQWLLGPVVNGWVARLNSAQMAKEKFNEIARICRQFFGSSARAMWEDEFKKQFFPTIDQPAFMINLNKAFELVALIGPALYWQNPDRKVRANEVPSQVGIAQLLGLIQTEEQAQMIAQSEQMIAAQKEVVCTLGTDYLNYSAKEQPNTLITEARKAIDESLITGLGLMWPQAYQHPATGERLTRNTYGSVDDLYIDPASKDPDWNDAGYIICHHCEPIWMLERRFGYPPGYLAGRGTRVSAEHNAVRQQNTTGEYYQDMIDWYEVWSRSGIGARISGVNTKYAQFLDAAIGDNVYICFTPSLPHPLNLPPKLLESGSIEDVKEAVRWRSHNFGPIHEVHIDNRWPVSPLIHHRTPGSAWPMAPLGPGVGYLIAINVIVCSKLQLAWDRRRDILGVSSIAMDDVVNALKSGDSPAVIPIKATTGIPLNQLIEYLQRPSSQDDLLAWLDFLMNEFTKATGLNELYYGMSQKQARVSSDVESKQQAANIRPDQMALNVVAWVKHFSTSELWLASQYVYGQQLTYLFGEYGALAWDQLFRSKPLQLLVKECECEIDPKDLKRPNYAKDLDALQFIAPTYFQAAMAYAQLKDDWDPINMFMNKMLEAMDMRDIEGLAFKSGSPPPTPEQQQQMQLQIQKLQADVLETQAKAYGRTQDTLYKQQGITPQQMQKILLDAEKHRQSLLQDGERHYQELLQDQETHEQDLAQKKQMARLPAPRTSK